MKVPVLFYCDNTMMMVMMMIIIVYSIISMNLYFSLRVSSSSGELASSQRHDLAVEARLNVAYLEIDELKRRVRMITIIIISSCCCYDSVL